MNVKVFIPDGNDLEFYFLRDAHLSSVCGISLESAREILNSAYVARRNQLIEKYVNTKIENAKKAGLQVNAGAISVECTEKMTGPTSIAVHGKLLLKGVRDELSARGIAGQVLANSDALRSEVVRNLWPE